ncbi:hypothetical protein CQZ93_14660 [Ochrobactrum vermis]|nr:hypothetical protein CQZ93_14660 [Ochrobactrum vermis]
MKLPLRRWWIKRWWGNYELKDEGMRILKRALSVGLCAVSLAGCVSGDGDGLRLIAESNRLDKEWKGQTIGSFEARFGAPSEKSTHLRWEKTSAPFWVPSQLYYQSMGNMSMRVNKPAHYETASCVIDVLYENGRITKIKTVEEGWINRKSFCQSTFGI